MSGQKRAFYFFFLFVIFLTIISSCSTSGKLYNIQEVNQLHGSVLQKVAFSRSHFQTFLAKTNNVLMFTFKDDKLFIADDRKKIIYPDSARILPADTLKVFGISNIEDLLNRGLEDSVYVEKRSNTISITYGNSTLEQPDLCPPICP
jgi:hypothetical protein